MDCNLVDNPLFQEIELQYMSQLPMQAGKFDDAFPSQSPMDDQPMSLGLSPNHVPLAIPPKVKFMMDWITTFYPQVSLEHSQMSLEQMYNHLRNGGKMMKSKEAKQAPKRKIKTADYWMALRKQLDSGKKLSVTESKILLKFELSQMDSCTGKKLLQQLHEDKQLRETMWKSI